MTITTIVLLLILSLAGMHIVEEENSSLRSEIQRRIQDQRVGPASHPVAAEELAKRSKTSQTITQHNELVAVLEQLEKVAPGGLVIELISLNPESKTYRVEIRTTELEAARRYVDKLNLGRASRQTWNIISVEAQKQNAEWLAVLEMR